MGRRRDAALWAFNLEIEASGRGDLYGYGEAAGTIEGVDAVVVEDACDGWIQRLESDAFVPGVVLYVGELRGPAEVGIDGESVAAVGRCEEHEDLWRGVVGAMDATDALEQGFRE